MGSCFRVGARLLVCKGSRGIFQFSETEGRGKYASEWHEHGSGQHEGLLKNLLSACRL